MSIRRAIDPRIATGLALAVMAVPASGGTAVPEARPAQPDAATTGTVHVTVTDLRSEHGLVQACLAPSRDGFPDCKTPDSRAVTLPAHNGMEITFPDVPSGRYAIALLHDENGNGKIDKALMIPREGFGFSQNAKLRMGPPAFSDAAFTVDEHGASQSIRMRYII